MIELKKISTLCEWLPKSSLKAKEGLDSGKYPFYTSSSKQTKWIDKYQFDIEGIIFGTGGNANIHFAESSFGVSTECVVAQKRETQNFNLKYVYYYLFTNIYILEKGFRGAGLKHISKKYIEDINIPLPDIDTQNKVVAVLDRIQSLLVKRENSIEYLERYLLSSYLILFGKKNPNYDKWEEVELDYYKKNKKSMRTGPFGSNLKHDMFKEEGDVMVLGIDNAVNNIFTVDKKRYITVDEYNKLKSYTIYPRDIIITIMGTVGRSAVIPDGIGLAINTKHLAAITLDEKKCNPYYLSYSIYSNPYIRFQIKARSRGAIMDGLNLGIIKGLKIKNAPIELQNKFEELYHKVNAFKNKLLLSKGLLINLFGSLSQRAFKGQLLFDISIEIDSLINSIDIKKDHTDNDISAFLRDKLYLQNLIDKIEMQNFNDIQQYEKAKYILFWLLKQEKVLQKYDVQEEKITFSL